MNTKQEYLLGYIKHPIYSRILDDHNYYILGEQTETTKGL